MSAAQTIDGLLADAGVGDVDAPVSGGVAGARGGTLSVMYAGTDDACAAVEPVLAGLSDRTRRVGDRPGMGQALKLLNNFLSATALAATSEAIAFGRSVGLDMGTMLEVLNGSSGRAWPPATSSRTTCSPALRRRLRQLVDGQGVRLYLGAVETQEAPSVLGPVVTSVWERFAEDEPGADFTRIYPFVETGTPQAENGLLILRDA